MFRTQQYKYHNGQNAIKHYWLCKEANKQNQLEKESQRIETDSDVMKIMESPDEDNKWAIIKILNDIKKK